MNRHLLPLALLALSLGALSACPGNLEICIDVDVDGNCIVLGQSGGDDDDDIDPGAIDFSVYDGIEYLNIDWDQQLEEQGRNDCNGPWTATGENTTADDGNLCPDCDHIWSIELVAQSTAESCITGTGLTFFEDYIRKMGIRFLSNTDFAVYRNSESANNVLNEVGIGAIQPGNQFTWSGIDQWEIDIDNGGYNYYFSGEGAF